MKRNLILGLAVMGIATAFATPAKAGVSFDIHIGLPVPPVPHVVIAPPPPRPVIVHAPPVYAPAPVVVYPHHAYYPPPIVAACPPPVVVHRPHFVPPGHAHRWGHHHVEYRHPGHGHGHGHGHRH